MNRHDRKMIVLALVWIVVTSILCGVVVNQITSAADHLISSGGAKAGVEKLWCGKPGCTEGKP